MTDWKARCVELLQAIDDDVLDVADGPRFQAAIDRTRAELAKPELEGPTDEETFALWSEMCGAFEEPTSWRDFDDIIRAALARFGRPAIEPVPVIERLPGEGDCDADGRCWWWDKDDDNLCLREHRPQILCWTHWLPHWALPVPTSQEPVN